VAASRGAIVAALRVWAALRFGTASRVRAVLRFGAALRFGAVLNVCAVSRAAALVLSLASTQVALSAEPAGASKSAALDVGRLTYEKWCAPCHAPGPDHPGTQALDALYNGSKPGALIERTDLTPPIVKQFVRKGVSVMPFFRKTEISDTELDALAAFLSRQK
jgi:mono/diheme cytochrome c family protein